MLLYLLGILNRVSQQLKNTGYGLCVSDQYLLLKTNYLLLITAHSSI